MLSKKSNSGLSHVRIKLRHVKIIDIIDHLQFSFGSILSTGFLFKRGFEHVLEIGSIGIEIEIDFSEGEIFRVLFG